MTIFLIVEVFSAKTLKTIDVCTDWFRYLQPTRRTARGVVTKRLSLFLFEDAAGLANAMNAYHYFNLYPVNYISSQSQFQFVLYCAYLVLLEFREENISPTSLFWDFLGGYL